MAIPSPSAGISPRQPAQPRRCRRTWRSCWPSSVPSTCSGSNSRTWSHVTGKLLHHRVPKAKERRSDSRLGGAERDALHLGHLRARPALEVSQLERRALLAREPGHSATCALRHVTRRGDLVGPRSVVCFAPGTHWLERARLENPSSERVYGERARDQQNPRLELAAGGVVLLGAPPQLHEGVLDEVLRRRIAPEHHHPESIDPRGEPVVEGAGRALVTAGEGSHQRGVVLGVTGAHA